MERLVEETEWEESSHHTPQPYLHVWFIFEWLLAGQALCFR
jgi:hypothetical protein